MPSTSTVESRVALFDLDDTLTDRQASLERYVGGMLQDFFAQLGAVDSAVVLDTIAEVDERGYAPREQVFRRLLSRLPWRSVPLLEDLADHWRSRYPRSAVLRPTALSTLNALLARGYTLGLVTNGPVALQQAKIDELGIESLFSSVVISEQVGVHKPDARVFQRALDDLACPAYRAWFIGDHPQNDVLGAAGAGLRPIWLAGIHPWPSGVERPGARIERLEEVLSVLESERTRADSA